MVLKVVIKGLSSILLNVEILEEFLEKGGSDLRGDYDYHHSTAGVQHTVTILIIVLGTLALAGLFLGLNILDHL
uniref:Uncharacterized protein n=1 Tax=Leviviridae sp. TaxID=2027243 RepID=A0A514D678_9VIRU|nr:MAG: hypothetical protein H3BulkLitter17903_000003 [Leviviridae sp.]